VKGEVNYIGPMDERPRYYANDHSRDVLNLEPHVVPITDVRNAQTPPTLWREGFALVPHVSMVRDFRNQEEVTRLHPDEIRGLLQRLTGADEVVVTGPGVLRFAERSADSGKLDNSRPARFVHIDISDTTAQAFADRSAPQGRGKIRRFAHYNVWRALSTPPQDTPLAVCDARSIAPEDLVAADAVFDKPGQPEWSFEGLTIRYNPAHRWVYFSNMTRDEALVFKTNDSDPEQPHNVPHSAFDDPSCPADVPPRSSIEMRAIAYWYE